MLTARAAALVVATLGMMTACSDDDAVAPDAGIDAGARDAGPPACLRIPGFGQPAPDWAACGICVEPRARAISIYRLGGTNHVRLAPVPDGLMVLSEQAGTFVTYVTLDGRVVPLPEFPYDPVDFAAGTRRTFFGNALVAPVPGTRQVWVESAFIGSSLTRPFPPSRGDFVLYEYGADGWTRRAAGHSHPLLQSLGNTFGALPSGELLGVFIDDDGYGRAAGRARALDGGTVDFVRKAFDDPDWATVAGIIPLTGGDVGVVTSRFELPGDGTYVYRPILRLTDTDLVPTAPPVDLSPEVGDPRFEPGEIPNLPRTQVRADGEASVLLHGALAGIGAASRSQFWIQRIAPDGRVRLALPGILVNADEFLYAADTTDGGRSDTLYGWVTAGRGDALLWYYYVGGRGLLGSVHAQLVDGDGVPWSTSGTRVALDAVDIQRLLASDGAGNAYFGSQAFADNPLAVHGMDPASLSPAWGPTFVQDCPTWESWNAFEIAGAHDAGVWVVWEENLRGSDGYSYPVMKVTLINPDGTFAWH